MAAGQRDDSRGKAVDLSYTEISLDFERRDGTSGHEMYTSAYKLESEDELCDARDRF